MCIRDRINTKLEDVLNEILPLAFAVMKDTARRFKENKEIVVKANDFDRNLDVYKRQGQPCYQKDVLIYR